MGPTTAARISRRGHKFVRVEEAVSPAETLEPAADRGGRRTFRTMMSHRSARSCLLTSDITWYFLLPYTLSEAAFFNDHNG
ncbi:MAG: hypothetical protein QGG09_09645, partial [Pirellulaceae bacterium]|nr:hypothetical protein [Pirellulaceae bacterium]